MCDQEFITLGVMNESESEEEREVRLCWRRETDRGKMLRLKLLID